MFVQYPINIQSPRLASLGDFLNSYTKHFKTLLTYCLKYFIFLLLLGSLMGCTKKNSPPTPSVREVTTKHSQNGLTLNVTNNSTVANAVVEKMINTFFAIYPQLVQRFNNEAAKELTFLIDPAYNGVAAASGNSVRFSAAWLLSNPADVDVVVHEIMHVVQAYPNYNPSWLTEGIADYVRYKYGLQNAAGGWSLPPFSAAQRYTDSYRVTARFLAWLEMKVDANLVNELDKRMRLQTYNDATWKTLTGKTIDELWQMYAQNPEL